MKKITMLLLALFVFLPNIYAQQSLERTITIEELFELTKKNHPNLKVSKADISIANQNIEVAKNNFLPEVKTGLQAFYLGDAHIIAKDFSDATKIDMPRFGNTFSIDATQLIWKGGMVQNNLKMQSLREELAALSYETGEQNIKLLVLTHYLELQKLYNQEDVYHKNIELAKHRLVNINKFYREGMVTRNDVIRGELQLSNLNLALLVVVNNQQILNKQLCVALGLDEDTLIRPADNLINQSFSINSLDDYQILAEQHPSVKMTQKAIGVYDIAGKVINSDRMPTLAAFAGNKLQRPITSSNPAIDMYTNGWNAGLSLTFNIDALYKTPKRMKLNELEQQKAIAQANEVVQMIDVAVNAAYVKYNEAIVQNNTLEVNKDLTVENYRIMESKYNNQLAILLDLIDASNARLDAELQFANSQINIVYSYYKLLKESGSL